MTAKAIKLNGHPFAADHETIASVVATLKAAGWRWCEEGETWLEPAGLVVEPGDVEELTLRVRGW